MTNFYILDASALLSVHQIVTFFSTGITEETNLFYTTKDIIDELKDSISKLRIESMIAAQILFIKEVTNENILFIQTKSEEIGNHKRLSPQDKSILSLAWQETKLHTNKSVILLSDDYEIQNTAKTLNLKFKSIKTTGINYTAKFKKVCQACGEELEKEEQFCPECGSTKIKNVKIFHNSKRPKNKNLEKNKKL